MWRPRRDLEPELLFSQPVSVGGARRAGWWPEPSGGWVSRSSRTASAWPRRPEPVAPRAPSWDEPRRTWAGSSPAPRCRARGFLSRGPAYARGPVAAARPRDVALRGAAAGPTCHLAGFPETFPSSHSRRIFPSGCLPFCLVFPSSLHCPHSWWSWPRPAPPTFADVELSQPFLRRTYFSLAKKKKSRGEVFERWKPGEGKTFK